MTTSDLPAATAVAAANDDTSIPAKVTENPAIPNAISTAAGAMPTPSATPRELNMSPSSVDQADMDDRQLTTGAHSDGVHQPHLASPYDNRRGAVLPGIALEVERDMDEEEEEEEEEEHDMMEGVDEELQIHPMKSASANHNHNNHNNHDNNGDVYCEEELDLMATEVEMRSPAAKPKSAASASKLHALAAEIKSRMEALAATSTTTTVAAAVADEAEEGEFCDDPPRAATNKLVSVDPLPANATAKSTPTSTAKMARISTRSQVDSGAEDDSTAASASTATPKPEKPSKTKRVAQAKETVEQLLAEDAAMGQGIIRASPKKRPVPEARVDKPDASPVVSGWGDAPAAADVSAGWGDAPVNVTKFDGALQASVPYDNNEQTANKNNNFNNNFNKNRNFNSNNNNSHHNNSQYGSGDHYDGGKSGYNSKGHTVPSSPAGSNTQSGTPFQSFTKSREARLYVGNLPPDTREYELAAAFAAYAPFVFVEIRNRSAFIQFRTRESMLAARDAERGKMRIRGQLVDVDVCRTLEELKSSNKWMSGSASHAVAASANATDAAQGHHHNQHYNQHNDSFAKEKRSRDQSTGHADTVHSQQQPKRQHRDTSASDFKSRDNTNNTGRRDSMSAGNHTAPGSVTGPTTVYTATLPRRAKNDRIDIQLIVPIHFPHESLGKLHGLLSSGGFLFDTYFARPRTLNYELAAETAVKDGAWAVAVLNMSDSHNERASWLRVYLPKSAGPGGAVSADVISIRDYNEPSYEEMLEKLKLNRARRIERLKGAPAAAIAQSSSSKSTADRAKKSSSTAKHESTSAKKPAANASSPSNAVAAVPGASPEALSAALPAASTNGNILAALPLLQNIVPAHMHMQLLSCLMGNDVGLVTLVNTITSAVTQLQAYLTMRGAPAAAVAPANPIASFLASAMPQMMPQQQLQPNMMQLMMQLQQQQQQQQQPLVAPSNSNSSGNNNTAIQISALRDALAGAAGPQMGQNALLAALLSSQEQQRTAAAAPVPPQQPSWPGSKPSQPAASSGGGQAQELDSFLQSMMVQQQQQQYETPAGNTATEMAENNDPPAIAAEVTQQQQQQNPADMLNSLIHMLAARGTNGGA